MRCAIYTRVSTDEQAQAEYSSLQTQQEICEHYIQVQREKRWELAEVYEDPGYSGKDLDRPAIQRLLQDVRQGKVDVVVAYRTVVAREDIRRAVDLVSQGRIDVVTFTSGSTVHGFFSAIDAPEALRDKFVAASIGPITTRALRDRGVEPRIQASRYTTQGLVEAILRYYEAVNDDKK